MPFASVPIVLNIKPTSKSFKYGAYLTCLIGHKLSGRFQHAANITPSQLTTVCSPLWFIKQTHLIHFWALWMTHFEMIRTESIKRTDHLFTFLFSKTYLDKLIRIDNHYYCQDKPLSHHWQHVILSRCIQLTLLHTILVSILYILPRLTQLGLYKGFSMCPILLSLYFGKDKNL